MVPASTQRREVPLTQGVYQGSLFANGSSGVEERALCAGTSTARQGTPCSRETSWNGPSGLSRLGPPRLEVEPGVYGVRLSKPGCYDIVLKGVQVQRVQILTVAQTFEGKPSIEITTNVDARISLDGREVGRTQDKRLVLDDLDVGTFKVTAARQDYLEQTRQVSITRKDEVGNVSFELAEIPVVAPPVVDYGDYRGGGGGYYGGEGGGGGDCGNPDEF